MDFSHEGIIRFGVEYEPAGGVGSRIAPATYAKDESHGHPAGPAITHDTPVRKMGDNGIDIVPGTRGDCVVIDSVSSQITRSESDLWNRYAEKFSLPGIVLFLGDEDIVTQAIEKELSSKTADVKNGLDVEALVQDFKARLNISSVDSHDPAPLSSWIFPHRHVDGIVRISALDPEGKKEIWRNKNSDLYNKIISASPHNVERLLNLSPNSALFGFWLSSDAPLLHKVSRSYSYDIVGYGASQVQYGATKISDFPTSAALSYDYNGEGFLEEDPEGKKASELLLGSVPSFSNAHVTTDHIVGSGSLLLGKLWADLHKDTTGKVDEEKREAAFNALCHLGVLSNVLSLQQWNIRSGCSLIPSQIHWESISPTSRTAMDVPTLVELEEETHSAIKKAQDMGIFGTADDREEVFFSKSHATVSASAFVKNLVK